MTQSDDQRQSTNSMRPMLQATGIRFVDATVDPSIPTAEYKARIVALREQQQFITNTAINREHVRRLAKWSAIAAVVAAIFVFNNYPSWFGDLTAGGGR